MSNRIRKDLIYITALMMDMSSGSARLGIPFFAFKLGASPLIIGIMASVNVALYVLFCLFSGKISDRVNRKRLPQIACIALTIIYFLVPQCKSLTSLFIVFSLSL